MKKKLKIISLMILIFLTILLIFLYFNNRKFNLIQNNNEIEDNIEEIKDNNIVEQKENTDEKNLVFELNGYQSLTLYVGDTYFEEGYTAISHLGEDISYKVEVNGFVDPDKEGKYTLIYSVLDDKGNKHELDRIINVVIPPDYNEKTIYFTFDDGPSRTTEKILDVLKEENIKATFFVINADKKYDKIIKRAFEEGHTIGLHSYSHKYKSIYKSEEAYFDDLELISDKVEDITGVESKIIRFPGGSSNTTSRISRGLMTKLSIKTKEKGYIYFDWNISSSDTTRISSKRIAKRVINQLGKYNTNIVLMHDFEYNTRTAKALKDIIRFGKENGYRFDKITEATPQIKHKIRN